MGMRPDEYIFSLLDSGSGVDMNVDGGTPVHFKYTVPTNHTAYIERINFTLLDITMQNDLFGGLAALTNGVLVRAYDADDTLLLDFLDGEPIKQNSDFCLLAGTDAPVSAGAGADFLPIRWTVAKAAEQNDGRLAALKLTEGQYIRVTVQDNLTGLDRFRGMVQGFLVPDIVP